MITEMKTINQLWLDYQRLAVAHDAGSDQVRQTHQAFMAGFLSCFLLVTRIGEPDVSEDTGVEIMSTLQKEIHQFVEAKNRQAGE